MATFKLKNWRDERDSQLGRAKKIILDKEIKLVDLSRLVDIPYQTLVNYRQDIDKLDKANWQFINRLAQAYDIVEIQTYMSQEDVFNTQDIVSDLFDQLPKNPMTKKMKQIITSDPLIIYELFKASDII